MAMRSRSLHQPQDQALIHDLRIELSLDGRAGSAVAIEPSEPAIRRNVDEQFVGRNDPVDVDAVIGTGGVSLVRRERSRTRATAIPRIGRSSPRVAPGPTTSSGVKSGAGA